MGSNDIEAVPEEQMKISQFSASALIPLGFEWTVERTSWRSGSSVAG
jgi:hypothetical protein